MMIKKNEFYEFYNDIEKKHLVSILIVCSILYFFQKTQLALGILFGGVLSGIFFYYFFKQIKHSGKHIEEDKKRITALFFLKYIIVYIITFVFLFFALKKGLHVFIGMCIGLLGIKAQIFINQFK